MYSPESAASGSCETAAQRRDTPDDCSDHVPTTANSETPIAAKPASPACTERPASAPSARASAAGPDTITLIRTKKGRVLTVEGSRLKKNLLGAVGFLELANAGDFAANVWNTIPIPVYAVVFMAIGGTVAAIMSIFAFRDARASWHNARFLWRQRQFLHEERARRLANEKGDDAGDGAAPREKKCGVRDIDVLLDVSYREMGSEVINRWGMDVLMGSGAIMIAAGTFMAIDGANRKVWYASNLLSGYLGNTPITVFGLINSSWTFYIWRTAHHHKANAAMALRSSPALGRMRRRLWNVEVYAVMNGMATLMGGVGSMITATRWWGYIILIPVIISSMFCNVWWRKRVGYDRPFLSGGSLDGISTRELVDMLDFAVRAQHEIRRRTAAPLDGLIVNAGSLAPVVNFLIENDLLEAYCLCLAKDAKLLAVLFDPQATGLTITAAELLAVPEPYHPAMIQIAQDCVAKVGLRHFQHREWYIAEILGSHLCMGDLALYAEEEEDSSNEMQTL